VTSGGSCEDFGAGALAACRRCCGVAAAGWLFARRSRVGHHSAVRPATAVMVSFLMELFPSARLVRNGRAFTLTAGTSGTAEWNMELFARRGATLR